MKSVYLIRDKNSHRLLTKFRTISGKLGKCIYQYSSSANYVIESQLKKHWLLSRFEWEVVNVGEAWTSPNFGKKDEQLKQLKVNHPIG